MKVDEPIPAALDGERLDRVVALVLGCSRSEATDLIGGGHVRIDGSVVDVRSRRLAVGMQLVVEAPDAEPPGAAPEPGIDFDVVHVDDHVIVVDKPAGLVVHPGAGHPDGTLVNGLLARFPDIADVGQPGRPGIVHRLDRGTSGLMVVARTSHAYETLVAALASHRVHRVYTAVALGHVEPGRGVIDAPIGRSSRNATRMTVTASGKPARTHYRVEREFSDPLAASLVTCRLETGRTHQIRVHLHAIGHPVLGDPVYGGVRGELPVARPFLHAGSLGFDHPGSGESVTFTAPMPRELVDLLGRFDGDG